MSNFRRTFIKFYSAIRSINNNLFRSLLTSFGVTVGIVSVFLMLTVSSTYSDVMEKSFSYQNSIALTIYGLPDNDYLNVQSYFNEYSQALKIKNISYFREKYAENLFISEACSSLCYPSIREIDEKYLEMNNIEVAVGSEINSFHTEKGIKVALITDELAEKAFPNDVPVDKLIQVDGEFYTIIGVVSSKSMPPYEREFIFFSFDKASISTTTEVNPNYTNSFSLLVEPENIEDLSSLEKDIKSGLLVSLYGNILKTYHMEDFSYRINVVNPESFAEMIAKIRLGSLLIFGVIGGISLFVSGIGIMNTMLASISERTNEIGLRKALGANSIDIVTLFLIETLMITFTGAFVAILFVINVINILNVFLINSYTEQWKSYLFEITVEVDPLNLFIVVLVTLLTALISGIYPAVRAARLNPIDALKAV